MRKLLVLVAVVNVLLAVFGSAAPTDEDTTQAPPKKCQETCTSDNSTVCGYDGTCYKEYRNKCSYDLEKCTKRNSLETVDISLCELAVKDNHPNFKICDE